MIKYGVEFRKYHEFYGTCSLMSQMYSENYKKPYSMQDKEIPKINISYHITQDTAHEDKGAVFLFV